MSTQRLAAIVMLLGLHAASHAACQTGLAERLHAKRHPGRALDHDLAVCEPWRGMPGRSIVVLPMPRDDAAPEARVLDLDVLVVQQPDNGNSERATVVGHVLQEGALTEGTSRITDIEVDPTRYRLAADVRAFGLRIARRSMPGPDPWSNETLSLYMVQDNRLRKVLDPLEVTMERGQWDASCTGQFEKRQSLISVGKPGPSGYADLNLRHSDWKSFNSQQGDECVEQAQPASYQSVTLRFDGNSYRISSGNEPTQARR